MKLLTVRRDGDGTFHQAFIPLNEEIDMKLKCNLCVKEHGNAVKTDQLLLVTLADGDKLVCVKHWERITGRKFHEPTINQPA